jgi:hypothetical protein
MASSCLARAYPTIIADEALGRTKLLHTSIEDNENTSPRLGFEKCHWRGWLASRVSVTAGICKPSVARFAFSLKLLHLSV